MLKTFFFISCILSIISIEQSEEKLHKKLETLYKEKAYQWIIGTHFYEMAKFYSKNKMADKSFIMLFKANQNKYSSFNDVYKHKDFLSLRHLQYWQYFDKIGKIPYNYSVVGYSVNEQTKVKNRIYTGILRIILGETQSNSREKLINKYKNYNIIKSYSKGGFSEFEIHYLYDTEKSIYIADKYIQFAENNIIYEFFFKQNKAIYYFYYNTKRWAVSYKDENGKIKWELL